MSTLTVKNKDTTPSLDGSNDLRPEVKTSLILKLEADAAAAKKKAEKSE